MPKNDIDYSNTIIYKIVCRDPSVKDVYVGHTTNFVQRKYSHKQICNNIKSSYYNLKLYKTIRANGNWSNWNMIKINSYNCKDHLEAIQKEREHLEALGANLNNENIETHTDTETDTSNNYNFICKLCEYKTNKKSSYEKHLLTEKHIHNTCRYTKIQKVAISSPKVALDLYKCSTCYKIFKYHSGLWRHKKTCFNLNKELNIEPNKELNNQKLIEKEDNNILMGNDIIMLLINENKEFKQMIMDQNKTILELSKKSMNIINNNNTNSHNKTFNLQFFLNEECKDALNISEFVSSIRVELEDLETTGRLGYAEGVSRIINKNLNNLDENKRPIHCSDLKREVLYIKNDDQWTKEDETKPILKKVIKEVANENIKQISEWRRKHPDCTASDSRKNDQYLKIVSNSMSGINSDEQVKNVNKIISNVAKETVIDK